MPKPKRSTKSSKSHRRAGPSNSNDGPKKITKKQRRNQEYLEYLTHMKDFSLQLSSLGLEIKDVKGDGNCMFRAISEQLFGHENNHKEIRMQAVEYMRAHKEDFAAFVIDSYEFEVYLSDMEKDSEWGGNLELHALSRKLDLNFVLHMRDRPAMVILKDPKMKTLHLAYHVGEHYSSVRSKDDSGSGPAKEICNNRWFNSNDSKYEEQYNENSNDEEEKQENNNYQEETKIDFQDSSKKEYNIDDDELFRLQMEELNLAYGESWKAKEEEEKINFNKGFKEVENFNEFEEPGFDDNLPIPKSEVSKPLKESKEKEKKSIKKKIPSSTPKDIDFLNHPKNSKCICNSNKKFKNCCAFKPAEQIKKELGIDISPKGDQIDGEKVVKHEKAILI